jgi:hypothetical protein
VLVLRAACSGQLRIWRHVLAVASSGQRVNRSQLSAAGYR